MFSRATQALAATAAQYDNLLCRCADMPLGHLNRRCHSHIVAIIPGPKEPDRLDAYLKPVLKEFKELGPKGGEAV